MAEADEMRSCPKCGKSIKTLATRCVWCFEKSEPVRKSTRQLAASDTVDHSETKGEAGLPKDSAEALTATHTGRRVESTAVLRYASSVQRRYRDAYVVAGEMVEQGQRLKVMAVIVATLIAIGALVAAMNAGRLAITVLVAGVFIAAGAYTVIHAHGVRIAAEGQLLLASLDVAVNTSPFLDESGRARAMSL
ncbi:MAG TPA: hypothetical protein VGQ76_08550 [Thermoanaerobaculia bacterium]|jgi:hypothetical protein|nr:hypothetical protein [Thermoanaerobaculia bacterium]